MVEEIAFKYKDRLNVIGLLVDVENSDGSPNEDKVLFAQRLMDEAGATFTNVPISEALDQALMRNISVVPTTLFVDECGNLTERMYTGSKTLSEWSAIIDEML